MHNGSTDRAAPSIRLLTGEVMHVRLRPAKNAFRYGVFYLRLPMRAMAAAEVQQDSHFFSLQRWNLLSFYDRDHGDGKQASVQWIDQLLHAEGIQDADGEIWLQCFPRVLGYVFNPVSFWFCHRADNSLRAIVCEVRNTFGEKHLYLLENGGTLHNGEALEARKIFHVSPFCNVEGRYRFRFLHKPEDEQKNGERHIAKIDYDDKDGPLLLTSISGTETAMTDRHVLRVMLRYPFMTLGVVLRIHLQALRLWIKRVPFFSKPLPPTEEVSR
ncbi:DUF1365 domain-containing protein [Undibacterium sp. SXout7W]|uniref:DUF1365 domain-containing protein n=1 Tax=Undibacterium sp. SXout7W TaxID=3413049 RepID=UPI003BF23776